MPYYGINMNTLKERKTHHKEALWKKHITAVVTAELLSTKQKLTLAKEPAAAIAVIAVRCAVGV